MAEEGRAEVVVVADTSQFRRQLDNELAAAGRSAGRSLDRSLQASLNRTGAQAGRQITRDIQRSLRNVRVQVQVSADMSGFRRELQAAVRSLPPVQVRVTPDASRFRRDLQNAARGMPPIVIPTINGGGRGGGSADVDRTTSSLLRLGSTASSVGKILTKGLKFASLSAGALGAAGAVGSLLAALAPAAGIIAGLPAALGGAAAIFASVKLGMDGIKESAKTLQPEFNKLKTAISGEWSDALGPAFDNLAAVFPKLQSGLKGIAADLAQGAAAAINFASTKTGISNIATILAGAREVTSGLGESLKPLTAGFLNVGAAVSDAFGERLGTSISNAASQLGKFMSSAEGGDRAVAWVEGAITVFKQIGGVISPLIGIFADLSKAMSAGGGTGLTGLATVLQTIRMAMEPLLPAIQQVSAAFAEGFAEAAPALYPIGEAVAGLMKALAPLLPLIGQVAAMVGRVLATALEALLPAIQPIVTALTGSLAPILPQLSGAFGALITALAPLAQMLGGAIAQAITLIVPLFMQILQALMPLLPIISQLGVTLLSALLPAIMQLAQAILPVIPMLLQGLVPAFAAIVTAVTPLIPLLVQLVMAAITPLLPLIPQIVQLVTMWVQATAEMAAQLVPVIALVIKFATAVLGWVATKVVVPVIKAIITVVRSIIGVLSSVIGAVVRFGTSLVTNFTGTFNRAKQIVSTAITAIVNFFKGLWSRISGFLTSLGSNIKKFFTSALNGAKNAVKSGLDAVVGFFSGLWGRIKNALGNIKDRIIDAIKPDISLNPADWFANGGIFSGPQVIGVGEAGPEVLIPLTRPDRARQLAKESGLLNILGNGGKGQTTINNTFNMSSRASDPSALAHLMLGHIARAAGS